MISEKLKPFTTDFYPIRCVGCGKFIHEKLLISPDLWKNLRLCCLRSIKASSTIYFDMDKLLERNPKKIIKISNKEKIEQPKFRTAFQETQLTIEKTDIELRLKEYSNMRSEEDPKHRGVPVIKTKFSIEKEKILDDTGEEIKYKTIKHPNGKDQILIPIFHGQYKAI